MSSSLRTVISSDLEIERRGYGGRTPLLSACLPRIPRHRFCYSHEERMTIIHLEAAQALLDAGADAQVTDDQGRAPIHWISSTSTPLDDAHQDAFIRLLDKSGTLSGTRDNDGYTPLHLCLLARQDWAVRRLIEYGLSCLEVDRDGNGPLHLLAGSLVELGRASPAKELFETFIRLGADINGRNSRGETPLFVFLSTSCKSCDTGLLQYITHCSVL
ncbi:ankyrin repeat-containing domain protein, partial [Microdochium bolleyi]